MSYKNIWSGPPKCRNPENGEMDGVATWYMILVVYCILLWYVSPMWLLMIFYIWLVVDKTPLKNISTLGWWNSQYMGKYISHVPFTTNKIYSTSSAFRFFGQISPSRGRKPTPAFCSSPEVAPSLQHGSVKPLELRSSAGLVLDPQWCWSRAWWYTHPSEKYKFVTWDDYSQHIHMHVYMCMYIYIYTSIYI